MTDELVSADLLAHLAEHGYEDSRVIANGAQGVVLSAVDRSLQRKVAIKVLRGGNFDYSRFLVESQINSKIPQKYAATVYAFRAPPALPPYIVQEYISEGSLLERMGGLTADDASRHLIQIAEALWVVHRLGIIHRDIKPSNIMFRANACILVDFGISKVIGSITQSDQTPMILGTPLYAAPEQLSQGRPDPKWDQYSFGVLAVEMVTGLHPYGHCETLPTTFSGWNEWSKNNADALTKSLRQLDPALRELFLKCTSFNPSDRFDHMGMVLERLTATRIETGGRVSDTVGVIHPELAEVATENRQRTRLLVSVTPVTVSQYLKVIDGKPSSDDRPITQLTLQQILDYIRLLCEITGSKFRLLTRAEWEHACNPSRSAKFCILGRDLDTLAEGDAIYRGAVRARRVSPSSVHDPRNRPNQFGLKGMHGNVWELVSNDDWYALKGGGFASEQYELSFDFTREYTPNRNMHDVGFRICQEIG